MITVKVVVTTRCFANEENEEAEKEFDFVEDYLSKTTFVLFIFPSMSQVSALVMWHFRVRWFLMSSF